MATRDQRGDGWTVVLRRQPARMLEGRPEGGYPDLYHQPAHATSMAR